MKKRDAYSLRLDADNSLAVKIRTGDKSTYHVEWVIPFAEGGPALPHQLRELARPRRRVVQHLANDHVSLMTASMPNLKSKLMKTALKGVVVKEKGGQRDDWIIDYKALPQRRRVDTARGQYSVSTVFVKQSYVEDQFARAHAVGCGPNGMLPGYLALEDLFRRHGPESETDGAWNVIFLGHKEQFLCVGDENSLLFSRPLPEDLSGGEERDEYINRLATEIDRSNFFAQQAERSMQVRRVIVCGQPDTADALVEALAERLDIEVTRWKPEGLFTAEEDKELWPYTLDLAAAAASYHGARYHLLPPGAVQGAGDRARRYATVGAVTFFAWTAPLILVCGLWTTRAQNNFLREAADLTDNLYHRAEAAASAYLLNRVFKTQQEAVDDLGGGQPDLAVLLNDIAERTPEDVIYSRLDLSRDKENRFQLVLHGESIARDGERAQRTFLEFLGAMNSCPHLQEIKEPVFLEINGLDDTKLPRSRVVFTLEYLIREDQKG